MTEYEKRIVMLESRVAILTECLLATLETPQAVKLIEYLNQTGLDPTGMRDAEGRGVHGERRSPTTEAVPMTDTRDERRKQDRRSIYRCRVPAAE